VKKIARADLKEYGIPPKHFNVNAVWLQNEERSGLKSFRVGVSHYLPGGGIEWSGEDSAEEKVYIVIEGELTVKGTDEEFVLGPLDSLYIGPNEGRSVINNGTKPAVMLVVVNA
jgi:mannose-6-phosphate isomerase-like protein (cupin superfamily)